METVEDRGDRVRLPAKQVAYDHIRREVLFGEDGLEARFLTEETIGSDLGLSRTPVREAFLRLEAEGLIKLVPNKGAVIPPITERDVREVMEVRSVLEEWAAREVCESEESRCKVATSLEALSVEMRRVGEAGEIADFIDYDRVFHGEPIVATGNRVMHDIYGRLRDQQVRMGVHAVLTGQERVEAVCAEHAAMVEAYGSGDAERVCAAIEAHLAATAGILYDRLGAAR